jgi:hypothetical protein
MSSQTQHAFKKNEHVAWKWGASWAYGQVKQIFTEPVTRTIKGKAITRKGSLEKPAYLLEQENGQEVVSKTQFPDNTCFY